MERLQVVRRLVSNSALVLASNLIVRGASAILFIVAAHRLTQADVGIFSLSITYQVIVLALASWGLDQFMIRDVARTPTAASYYLTNFVVLRLVLVGLAYGGLGLILALFHPYSSFTTHIIWIIGLSAIPDSLTDICQSVFIARERFLYPSLVSIGLALVRIGLGIVILLIRADLLWMAWIFPITSLVSLAGMTSLILASGIRPVLHLDPKWLTRMFGVGTPLAVINILLVLDVQIGAVMLSLLVSEKSVALYGAANAIFTASAMMPAAWQMSIFPMMSRLHARSDESFRLLYDKMYRYLTIGAFALILGIVALADVLIRALYGSSFENSAVLLRILAATLLFTFLNVPNSRLMIILNRQDVLALFLMLSVLINLVLIWLLIPRQGLTIVAMARFVSSGSFFLMNYIFVSARVMRVNILRLIGRPLLAGMGAFVILLFLRQVAPLWRTMGTLMAYGALLPMLGAISHDDLALVLRRT